jgi:hypothetical protein
MLSAAPSETPGPCAGLTCQRRLSARTVLAVTISLVERGAVIIDLIEKNTVRGVGVLADIELLASGFLAHGCGSVFSHQRQELGQTVGFDLEINDDRIHCPVSGITLPLAGAPGRLLSWRWFPYHRQIPSGGVRLPQSPPRQHPQSVPPQLHRPAGRIARQGNPASSPR